MTKIIPDNTPSHNSDKYWYSIIVKPTFPTNGLFQLNSTSLFNNRA